MDRLSTNNLDVVEDEGVQYLDPFIQILSDIPGGGTLKSSEPATDMQVLNRGVMLAESSSTDGIYNIVKTQKSDSTQSAAVTLTLVTAATGIGLFKVGEYISKYGAATASTITTVTRTSATQDTIITGTAIGALATASIICEESAASTVVAATLSGQYDAIGLSRSVLKVRECDNTTLNNVNVGIVTRGEVNESLLPYAIDAGQKTNLTARIIFT